MNFKRGYFKQALIVLVIMVFNGQLKAQDTSVRVLPVVPILKIPFNDVLMTDVAHGSPRYVLRVENLQRLGVLDVGSAMKFMPGIQLKDYGGIGGLKTISYRSLGAAHNALSLDGNIQPNTQTGVMDLGSFEIFGLSELVFTAGQPKSQKLMASAYLPVSSIAVQSKIADPADTSLIATLYQNVTSIHAYESGVLIKAPVKKKSFIGGQFMTKYGSGSYPFHYNLSGSDELFQRTNADLISYKARFFGQTNWRFSELNAGFTFYDLDQQLPGAVILYNPSNDQELHKRNYRGDASFSYQKPKWNIRSNAYFQTTETHYFDPEFLNQQGFLESNYDQRQTGAGVMFNRQLKTENNRLFAGSDFQWANLSGSNFQTRPLRVNSNSVVGISYWFSRFLIESNVCLQYIHDVADSAGIKQPTDRFKWSPFFSVSVHPFQQIGLKIRAYYKNAFRMPSFNDLYYNFIGNNHLKPENAHLTNIGFTFVHQKNRYRIEGNLDGFLNYVQNKIVAIPTKDLFNWSMQNLGKTRALGADFSLSYALKINKWIWTMSTNHTFNSVVDISDPNLPSYGDQIPYTPLYTTSNALALGYRGYTLTSSVMYSGVRYALNENIPINRLEPYVDLSLGVEKEFRFNPFSLWASFKVMNVLNNYYEVVRSFPMPGRYYQFTIKFNYK